MTPRGVGWREEALSRRHDRAGFDCGVPALNEYLQRYARQNHESGGAKTFVGVPPEWPSTILGYYTIAPGAIDFGKVPDAAKKGLRRDEWRSTRRTIERRSGTSFLALCVSSTTL